MFFGLIGNKNKKLKTLSRIGLTRQGAFLDILKVVSPAKKPVYIFYFFEESKDYLKSLLTTEYFSFKDISSEPATSDSDVYFINARNFNPHAYKFTSVKLLYCLDHFPLASVHLKFIQSLEEMSSPAELIIYGGLDEPILQKFGGEKIQQLMQRMGIGESEMIEHEMISAAIANAQKKIEEKVKVESKANNALEWFRLNFNQ